MQCQPFSSSPKSTVGHPYVGFGTVAFPHGEFGGLSIRGQCDILDTSHGLPFVGRSGTRPCGKSSILGRICLEGGRPVKMEEKPKGNRRVVTYRLNPGLTNTSPLSPKGPDTRARSLSPSENHVSVMPSLICELHHGPPKVQHLRPSLQKD